MKKNNRRNRSSLDRRTFLKAAGLSAGAFFLPSLARGDQEASAGARPRRVIFMMAELGWNPFEFRMAPPGAPDELLLRSAYHPTYSGQPDTASWELDLRRTPQSDYSHILEPLYPMRDRALVLDGLGMLSIGLDDLGDAHARGWNHGLSGHPASRFITGQKSWGGAPSIDMLIAAHLRATEPGLTDLTALHYTLNQWNSGPGTGGFHHHFYDYGPSGEIIKVPVEGDSTKLFDRLFPDTGTEQGSPEAAAEARVLDALNERYGATYKHLSGSDRQKLDLHRDTISDIQQRLDVLSNLSCEVPNRPEHLHHMEDRLDHYENNVAAFFELTKVAFACDLTRVASIQLANPGAVAKAYWGAGDYDFHEWYSHGTNPPKRWRGVEGARVSEDEHDKFLDASPVIANKNRYHVELAVRLANLLDEVPDGDGTLLDSTLIVLTDEISHGSHGHDQWPVVLLGGFGGAFRMGRYVRFPRTNPAPRFNGSGSFAGVPHNHLLISICQAMGLPINDLGVQSVYARHSGYAGQSIDLTGPLDALY